MKANKIFNTKSLLVALVAAIGTMSSASVFAQVTESGAMTVSATLTSGCTVSDSALDFGDDISALLSTGDILGDTGSTLNIACSSGAEPVIYTTSARTLAGTGDATGGSITFNRFIRQVRTLELTDQSIMGFMQRHNF